MFSCCTASVDEQVVEDNASRAEASPTPAKASAPAPETRTPAAEPTPASAPRGMILTFMSENRTEVDITFEQAPLGMKYKTGEVPVIIHDFAPNSYAQSRGVQIGTQLVKVNGEDMRTADFATLDSAVKAACATL